MHLENVVFDATDPHALGRSWEARLGTETLTDVPEGFETRLAVPDGPVLDLCFQRVDDLTTGRSRLELEGERPDTLDALRLEVADPAGEAGFWSWLTGWLPSARDDSAHAAQVEARLRHPSGLGPALVLVGERVPKGAEKNPVHLDIRLDPGDTLEEVANGIDERGGRSLHFDWGELPWRHFADPSGNELCVLPAPQTAKAD